MILRALSFTLTDSELSANFPRAFEQVKQIKDPKLSFEDGAIIFSGKFVAGIIPVPFQAHCALSAEEDGKVLRVCLQKVKAAFFSGGGEQIISAMKDKIGVVPGVRPEGDSLYITLSEIGATKGMHIQGQLKSITIGNHELTLELA
ncbi:MAG: hypothetical protein ACI4X9_03050 [Kiritimatiellia bacterium]